MPSNPDSGIHFRDKELAEWLDGYAGREQRYQSAKQMLERYRWLVDQALSEVAMFPDAAISLWSELNGCHTRHPEELPILQQSVAIALQETGHEALALSVRSMGLLHWVAVVDACDRVGGGSYQVENLEDELRRVGLCK